MRVLLLCVVLALTAPACTGGSAPPGLADSGLAGAGLTDAGLLVGVPLCAGAPYRPEPFDLWTLQVADGGWTRADAGTSGCDDSSIRTDRSVKNDGSCAGVATASLDGGPRLTFDDGSSLTWTTNPTSFLPPLLTEGQRVSVGVQRFDQSVMFSPGVSTFYERRVAVQTLEGAWLWSSAASKYQAPLPSAELAAVLGVGGSAGAPSCQQVVDNCQRFRRVLVAQVLDTSPPTALASGEPTVVVTPTGRWQVSVVRAEDTALTLRCPDTDDLGSINGFVFSRVGP
jgi:hypothetical protein